MHVVKSDRYLDELEAILHFIAEDSLTQALAFADRLNVIILDLASMPWRCRPSLKSDDANVRDLVFEGYVIPYRINPARDRIEVLGIFNQNRWEL